MLSAFFFKVSFSAYTDFHILPPTPMGPQGPTALFQIEKKGVCFHFALVKQTNTTHWSHPAPKGQGQQTNKNEQKISWLLLSFLILFYFIEIKYVSLALNFLRVFQLILFLFLKSLVLLHTERKVDKSCLLDTW